MSTPLIEDGPGPGPADAGLADEVVTVSRAELEGLRALAAVGSAPRDATDGDPAARRERAMTDELTARDRKVADLESAYRRAIRDRELATALAGRPLVSGAASQLISLWRDDFDVYEESGEYKVAARDGRAVSQWVADRLSHSDYAHFCLAPSRGGSGAKGLSQSGAADGLAAPAARTLGEAVISQWRESAARAGPSPGPAGWGRR